MAGSLIPLLIAGGILVLLGGLLWLGARERRQFSILHDADLGDLKLFKTYWEAAAPAVIKQQPFSVSGVGSATGPTAIQKNTLEFVKTNIEQLSNLAVDAAQKAIAGTAPDLRANDLRVSLIFLHKEANSFELSLESESCAIAIPDGLSVSFTGKQIDDVEFVH